MVSKKDPNFRAYFKWQMTSPGLIFRLDRYIGIIKIIILTLLMNMLHFIPILEFRSCFSTNFTVSKRFL